MTPSTPLRLRTVRQATALAATGLVLAAAHAQAPVEPVPHRAVAEADLVGKWQDNSFDPQQLPADERARRARSTDVVEYRADHSFALWPKCANQAEWKSKGFASITGTWQLGADGRLTLSTVRAGQTMAHAVQVWFEGDALVMNDVPASVTRAYRYGGPVPLACS